MFHFNQLVRVLAIFLMILIRYKICAQKILFVAVLRTHVQSVSVQNQAFCINDCINRMQGRIDMKFSPFLTIINRNRMAQPKKVRLNYIWFRKCHL